MGEIYSIFKTIKTQYIYCKYGIQYSESLDFAFYDE